MGLFGFDYLFLNTLLGNSELIIGYFSQNPNVLEEWRVARIIVLALEDPRCLCINLNGNCVMLHLPCCGDVEKLNTCFPYRLDLIIRVPAGETL